MNCNIIPLVSLGCWFLTSLAQTATQHAKIITPPEPRKITLNRTAVVSCTAIATLIDWKVNDRPVDINTRHRGFDDSTPLLLLNATENLRKRTMTVLGAIDNNGTNVTCVAVSFNPPSLDKSPPAVIYVYEHLHKQGLLEPVNNLTVTTINSTTVLISWSPPFTLEEVPILGYNVTITNTTSGENETMLVVDTTLLYSIDSDNEFTITVVPINAVGPGQPAAIYFPLSPTQTIDATSTTVPLVVTPDSRAPVVQSVVVIVSAVTMVTMTAILAIILSCSCCLFKKHQKIKEITTEDVVPVSINPAYWEVTTTSRNIKTKENSAYAMVHPTIVTSPHYENISVGVNMKYEH